MTRLLLLRLEAHDDLVEALETAARDSGFVDARVHAGPGSLMHANLETGAATIHAPGPAAEILVMTGEISRGVATLHGAVGDPEGRVYAGRFIRGRNPICITVECVLEELSPSP